MIDLLKSKQLCKQSVDFHVKCYQNYKEFLLVNGLMYCCESVSLWLGAIKETENRQVYHAYRIYMCQLGELIDTGSVFNDI